MSDWSSDVCSSDLWHACTPGGGVCLPASPIHRDIRCADCSPPLPSPPWPRLHQLRPLTQLCSVMALWTRSSLFVPPDLAAACSPDHPSRFHHDGDYLAAGVPLLCPSPSSCTGLSPTVTHSSEESR